MIILPFMPSWSIGILPVFQAGVSLESVSGCVSVKHGNEIPGATMQIKLSASINEADFLEAIRESAIDKGVEVVKPKSHLVLKRMIAAGFYALVKRISKILL
jgi:hypothetical protein